MPHWLLPGAVLKSGAFVVRHEKQSAPHIHTVVLSFLEAGVTAFARPTFCPAKKKSLGRTNHR